MEESIMKKNNKLIRIYNHNKVTRKKEKER
jgi:hypothetical protein